MQHDGLDTHLCLLENISAGFPKKVACVEVIRNFHLCNWCLSNWCGHSTWTAYGTESQCIAHNVHNVYIQCVVIHISIIQVFLPD